MAQKVSSTLYKIQELIFEHSSATAKLDKDCRRIESKWCGEKSSETTFEAMTDLCYCDQGDEALQGPIRRRRPNLPPDGDAEGRRRSPEPFRLPDPRRS